jgi:hypothetical protein
LAENATLAQRIEPCTRDLVLVHERLCDSDGGRETSASEQKNAHLQ